MLRTLLFMPVCMAALASVGASARSLLIFDASAEKPAPAVSVPERAALKRLYTAKGVKVCSDFQVTMRQQGAFTAARKQTLYLVQNCYNDGAMNPMRERWQNDLLVLDGTRLNYFEVGFADEVTVMPALQGKPLQPLLVQTWFGPHMGEFVSHGELQLFRHGHFEGLLDLGTVYSDTDQLNADQTDIVGGKAARRTLWFDPARPNVLTLREYASPYSNKPNKYDAQQARKTLDVSIDLRRLPQKPKW